ncbi:MAG: adenylate/guanylate cyclase domain-containing protein [Bacteroides sp.]
MGHSVCPFLVAVIACVLLILGFLVVRGVLLYYSALDRARYEMLLSQRSTELVREKERVENILARMLPMHAAQELQKMGRVQTERYSMVTVLFADIEGFTMITDRTNPEQLIDALDRFFFYLDSVAQRYHIEKIKTIGDAYMCAGGLPRRNRTNPVEVVLAATDMLEHMRRLNEELHRDDVQWGLRIGVNTGQVISGVIGRDKLSYDIWGSAVNVASRMESSSAPGRINISESTYFFVKEFFDCTPRGQMPIKNRGNVSMYFVEGIRPELSENGEKKLPNADFWLKLQVVRLGDVEDYAISLLEEKLPKNLYYHGVKHTLDVYTQVELLGVQEGVSTEDLLLLRTAALFHDAGHIVDYQTHEEMGVKMVYEVLPDFQYSKPQIDEVARLILATKMPVHPHDLLEKIMCDADLDYLGRVDYIPVAAKLYEELKERGLVGELADWVNMQIKFMENHQYYTATAQHMREANKQEQLRKLKAWRSEALGGSAKNLLG